jgi:hypothetical protein
MMIELCILLWENKMFTKMLWQGEEPFPQGIKASYVSRISVLALGVYILLIIAGSMIQEGRTCHTA